jgi:hypothetical protein
MFFRKTALLALSITLFVFMVTFTADIANAKNPKDPVSPPKPWAVIEGFRSARFGMDMAQVRRAIFKDFKVHKNLIRQDSHPRHKTNQLTVTLKNLVIPDGTICQITYIFGYKSKKLTRVQLFWGNGVTDKKVDVQKVILVANSLKTHFVKKRYRKKGFVVNQKFKDGTLCIFRGKDEKGRMILLTLKNPSPKNNLKILSLSLSYLSKVKKLDTFSNNTKNNKLKQNNSPLFRNGS